MKTKLKPGLVGWHGIVAEVPSDWNLAAIGGEEKAGYFRADSPGTLALEVKWSESPKEADLRGQLETFLKDLKRKSRKHKAGFEYKIRSRDQGALAFTWQADRKAVGKLWRCEKCKRVLIAQVSGGPSDDVNGLASLILPSIADHTEDGWRTWAVYELVAEVPPGYKLEKHQLMAGYIQLIFRNRNNRLTIERWGIADVALKKTTIKEWFGDRIRHDYAPYRYTIDEVDSDDEPAVRVTGRHAGVRQALKSLGELIVLRKPAVFLDCYAWVCEESNKIYAVQSVHSRIEQVLDAVAERVECH